MFALADFQIGRRLRVGDPVPDLERGLEFVPAQGVQAGER